MVLAGVILLLQAEELDGGDNYLGEKKAAN